MTDFQALARAAAVEAHDEKSVGAFIEAVQEPDAGVVTYLFASALKGYPDWRISVSLFESGDSATISEVLVVPGPESLTAPAWVPWSERLADYKALQAALEAEAAAAAEAAEDEEDDEDPDAESDAVAEDSSDPVIDDNSAEISESELTETSDDSALSDVPVAVDAQSDADETRGKGKGLFKWKTLRGGKKRK
jgi:hypothetical protein